MPDNTAYHCMYVFRWTYLINKYNLSANQVDKDKIHKVIGVSGNVKMTHPGN